LRPSEDVLYVAVIVNGFGTLGMEVVPDDAWLRIVPSDVPCGAPPHPAASREMATPRASVPGRVLILQPMMPPIPVDLLDRL
jgi:hypothetical protein